MINEPPNLQNCRRVDKLEFESKFNEWLEPTRDKLYKGLLDNSPLNELNAYKALCRYFAFLIGESKYVNAAGQRSVWSTLDQKSKNKVIVEFFTDNTAHYGKTLLPLLPEDIKNYILALSL